MKDDEILKRMLRTFISDVEKGRPLEDAGWVKKEPNVEAVLERLGLIEHGAQGIRVSLHNPLPKYLLKTEEGDLYSDMQLAARVREFIPQIVRDRYLQTGAEIYGFAHMLGVSDFPVLSHRLFQEGFSSFNEWCVNASCATYLLTSLAAKKVWDVEDIESALKPLRQPPLSAIRVRQCEEIETDRVRKVLKWDKVLEIVNKNACKVMGFLWYVDSLTVVERIRYPESMALIQERAWRILEERYRKSTQELRDAVIKSVDHVEQGTADRGFAIAPWHEILRLPW